MKKNLLIIIAVAFFVLLLVFLLFFLKKENANLIKAYGNIEIRQVDLSFQVSGIIKKLYVEEGDCVKSGQLLAELIDKDYLANYNQSRFAQMSSKAQAKEDNDKYQRNLPLCKDGTLSKQDCDTLLNQRDLSQALYQQNLASQEFQKNQLGYTKMFAPQDGIITTRVEEMGARVNANQIVYVLSLTKPVWIRTYVKETELGNIKYGQKARILTDTIDLKTGKKKEYQGYIGYISPVAEFTPKTVQTQDLRTDLVYRIRVYVDEVDEYLRQGMPVTVEIPLDKQNS